VKRQPESPYLRHWNNEDNEGPTQVENTSRDGDQIRGDAVTLVFPVPLIPEVADRSALKDVQPEERHVRNVADYDDDPTDATKFCPREDSDIKE
jgi:hypothetical protein